MPRVEIPVQPESEVEFDQAFELLRTLADFEQIEKLFPQAPHAVYTAAVVLWMLIYQRMNSDSSLEAAVKKFIEGAPAFARPNKRIEEGNLSTATGSYSVARSKLPLEAVQWLAENVSQSLIDASPATYGDRRVFLIDGTTVTTAPEPALAKEFPPATNQYGATVWPVALLVVAHELDSGAALIPQIGPMYGPHAVSETALARGCLEQLPRDGVAMADSGFGIFRVAYDARQTAHPFLFRMTKSRFESLCKKAALIAEGENWQTYSHSWQPSQKERRSHPDLPHDALLEVRLHKVVVNDNLTLHLVTDLLAAEDTALALAGVYRRRYDVEIDIRNLKLVLDMEQIRAKSVAMFRKELLITMVTYNLVTQFRRQAAELAKVPPRRMSFKRTLTTYRTFLLSAMYTDAESWRIQYHKALKCAMQDKLPNRPNRSYEREVYHRRPKSNQFKKRKSRHEPTATPK
jgi:hypothetical protein